jgi:hypothetical protein
MFAPALVPLLFSLLSPASPVLFRSAPNSAEDPPVKVWLSSKGDFFLGETAKTYAQTKEDGYLVVLHADARGRIRVLFPIDPTDDQFVRGGKKHELKGRGNREAFVVDDSGRGSVFAAYSKSRFAVEKFTQNGHWDYRALALDSANADPEAELMDIVHEMQPVERYTYDVATYVVTDPRYAYRGRPRMAPVWGGRGGWYSPRVGVSILLGPRWGRGVYGRSYFYDPFYYGGFWGW